MSELRLEQIKLAQLGPVDLKVGAAEIVCLSGESGAGKSVLLRSIVDLIPHEGHVFLDGKSSAEYPAPEWRKKVGLLPAESQWWRDTVAAHFNGADTKMLKALGLPETAMDWQLSRCSTGEKQRLAILRLLAKHPACLLLDEPTGSLDPENTKRVEQLIRQLAERDQIPIIWVSHSEEQIQRIADRHFVVRDGGLVEQ